LGLWRISVVAGRSGSSTSYSNAPVNCLSCHAGDDAGVAAEVQLDYWMELVVVVEKIRKLQSTCNQ